PIRRPSRSSAIVTVPTIRIDAGGGGAGSATSGLGRAADVQPSAEASTISTAARPLARPTGLPLHLSMAPPPEKQKDGPRGPSRAFRPLPGGPRRNAPPAQGGRGASGVPPAHLSRSGGPFGAPRRSLARRYRTVTPARYDLS